MVKCLFCGHLRSQHSGKYSSKFFNKRPCLCVGCVCKDFVGGDV